MDAIQSALTAALSSIGQSDNEGARKAALDAISAALTNALDAIGESNAEGARGAAISAINQLYETIEAAITQANDTIDQKVESASDSAELAEKWSENPEDSPVEGSGDDAKFSAKHHAERAKYWANQAQAAVNIPDIYGYSETIGDGSTLEFTITHNMNTTTIIHDVWANTDDGVGFYSISTINANSLKITFEEAPAVGAITVNLLPVRLKNAN